MGSKGGFEAFAAPPHGRIGSGRLGRGHLYSVDAQRVWRQEGEMPFWGWDSAACATNFASAFETSNCNLLTPKTHQSWTTTHRLLPKAHPPKSEWTPLSAKFARAKWAPMPSKFFRMASTTTKT